MKIEEVRSLMQGLFPAEITEDQLYVWSDALEQHHKDLMGLVETWRHISSLRDSPLPYQACYIIGECADQLASLINPKD